jgi:putative endonuclease
MEARAIGSQWEDAALAWLQAAGLRLVARNFHCRLGEIDLSMLDGGRLDGGRLDGGRLDGGRLDRSRPDPGGDDGDAIVFAEVRYRNTNARGDGTTSVGVAKVRKLVRAAQIWLQQNPRHASQPCRFDVIGCSGTLARPHFEWTRNAFDAFDDIR